ncbi:hypothetical protein C7475_105163 [Chitinophaga sp. S165]|nr:hypothetical protein C7475_105163 [Chitinophaga sp. S165]
MHHMLFNKHMTPCSSLLIKASGHSNIYFAAYNKCIGGERYSYLYRLYEKWAYPHFRPVF